MSTKETPNTHPPAFQLQNLVKAYAGRRVVQIETLTIPRGRIFTLIGPSGAGKSTLLRLLNFLEPPTSGSLIFEGQPVNLGEDAPLELRRRVTMVFQRPMLLTGSVWDNVAYGLKIRGWHSKREDIQAMLNLVGMSKLARASAQKLSGGEAQRVALARALVIKPDVLLLDEPTANLDPYNVSLIEKIITEVNAEQNVTVILVTHNIFQARRLGHLAALLLDGYVIEAGTAYQLFQSPQDPRTSAFVAGDMVY
jgi:tungstate transport system ATP-binding protein